MLLPLAVPISHLSKTIIYCTNLNSVKYLCAITGATFSCCAAYGQGTGDIVLDDLACTGTEASLFSCIHNGLSNHNCGHSEDVGVTCLGKLLSTCKGGRLVYNLHK